LPSAEGKERGSLVGSQASPPDANAKHSMKRGFRKHLLPAQSNIDVTYIVIVNCFHAPPLRLVGSIFLLTLRLLSIKQVEKVTAMDLFLLASSLPGRYNSSKGASLLSNFVHVLVWSTPK
jgi:hypothetical protein